MNAIKKVTLKKKSQTSIAFEHVDKKIKLTPINKKLVNEPDEIISSVPQVRNSNATV